MVESRFIFKINSWITFTCMIIVPNIKCSKHKTDRVWGPVCKSYNTFKNERLELAKLYCQSNTITVLTQKNRLWGACLGKFMLIKKRIIKRPYRLCREYITIYWAKQIKKQASQRCLRNKEFSCLKAIVKKQLKILRELRNPLNSNYHNTLDNTIIKELLNKLLVKYFKAIVWGDL